MLECSGHFGYRPRVLRVDEGSWNGAHGPSEADIYTAHVCVVRAQRLYESPINQTYLTMTMVDG